MVDLPGVSTIKPHWLEPNSGFKVLVQFGRETRVAAPPDVPTARELALNPNTRALIEWTELPYRSRHRPACHPPAPTRYNKPSSRPTRTRSSLPRRRKRTSTSAPSGRKRSRARSARSSRRRRTCSSISRSSSPTARGKQSFRAQRAASPKFVPRSHALNSGSGLRLREMSRTSSAPVAEPDFPAPSVAARPDRRWCLSTCRGFGPYRSPRCRYSSLSSRRTAAAIPPETRP